MKKKLFSFRKEQEMNQEYQNIVKLNWIQRYIIGSKLSTLKDQLEEKNIEILNTKRENHKLLSDLKESNNKAHETLVKLKDQTNSIHKGNQERDQIIKKVNELKNEIELSKVENKDLKENYNDILETKNNLENNLTKLNEKIRSLETSNNNIRISNEEKKKNIDRLESQVAVEKRFKEEYQEKLEDIMEEFSLNQEHLQKQLENVQNKCQRIENEKLEIVNNFHAQKAEIDVMQAQFGQNEYELKQQVESYDLKLDRYRIILNYFQIASSIALYQTMDGFAAALIRSICMSYAEELLAGYLQIDDTMHAISECGLWFMEIQLCTDFKISHEDGILCCYWHYNQLVTTSPKFNGAMTNEWLIGILWGLLSMKTEKRWNCSREFDENAESARVAFHMLND